MKLKKIASLMLAGVMAVSMLAGCSNGNNGGNNGGDNGGDSSGGIQIGSESPQLDEDHEAVIVW